MGGLARSVAEKFQFHLCPRDLSANNFYGLNELGFVDLTDPGVTTPNRISYFHTPIVTVMLGDLGTEDDLKTARPETLKMIAPDSTSTTILMPVPSRATISAAISSGRTATPNRHG